MKYDAILARSFSRDERRKLGCGALVGCLIVTLSLCMVFKSYLSPLTVPNFRLSMSMTFKMFTVEDSSSSQHIEDAEKASKQMEPMCEVWKPISDYCRINGDVRIHGNSSTIFVASSQISILAANGSWSIRPYARKGDRFAMSQVSNFSVKLVTAGHRGLPHCTINHSVPAVLFSIGGYTGNHFHDFTDVLIPLYSTSRRFNGDVQFLVSDHRKSLWITKFQAILKKLSRYEIISIDGEDKVRCFPSMIVGLTKHQKELSIDPSESSYSMRDFREFLRSSYSLKRATAIKIRDGGDRKPRILIISRRSSRSFTNEGEIAEMARSLGFDVIVTEATRDVTKFAEIVNSCDVLMGVHGAGLTNMVFLPERAILIQVVPWGSMEWLAKYYFGKPAADMNIRYLEYKIREGESTLIQQYPLDHEVFGHPFSIQKLGWAAFKSVYMDKQDVKLDVVRFRATMLEALQLLRQ